MEKIIYQGKELEAQLVNAACGHLNAKLEAEEHLYRDAEGKYYLQRTAFDGAKDVAHRVQRVTLTAAILWAIERADPSTKELRIDAAAALAGRERRDTAPADPLTVNLSPEAVKAVLAYEKATGFDLDDIASGILVGELTAVLQLTDNRDDENWRIKAGDVQAAARLRKKGGAN